MTDVAGPVLIAGGGIAGLAAALAFAQHSIPAEVLEREADFSETGAGIQLGPNAVRIVDSLGAAEFLQPLAITPRTLAIHDGVSGKTLTNLPLGQAMRVRFGAPYWTVHRGDLLNRSCNFGTSLGTAAFRLCAVLSLGTPRCSYYGHRSQHVEILAADRHCGQFKTRGF